jgi:hypothetical protein
LKAYPFIKVMVALQGCSRGDTWLPLVSQQLKQWIVGSSNPHWLAAGCIASGSGLGVHAPMYAAEPGGRFAPADIQDFLQLTLHTAAAVVRFR